jgi:hypothetical protein
MMRWLPFALLAVVGGCQCLQPVVECPRRGCHAVFDGGVDAGPDAGELDAGLCVAWDGGGTSTGSDAGLDGGPVATRGYLFLGDTCDDALITQPVTTPGVFTSLTACVECGCDPTKMVFLIGGPDGGFTPSSYCDQLDVVTNSPQFVNEAFPDLAGGCQAPECTVWRATASDAGVVTGLGDAGLARACQATLVTNVSQVRCTVFIH